MMRVDKLIVQGGGEIDVSEYLNFWCESPGYGGGSSGNTPQSICDAISGFEGWPGLMLIFSKRVDMFGRKDPGGLIVMVRSIAAIKPMDPKLEALLFE